MWGADVTLAPLNLCAETLDGIRNHSWSRPAPSTPEGEVVSAGPTASPTCCHDFEDAVAAGIVAAEMLPAVVADRCGASRSAQLGAFIAAMVDAAAETGRVGMVEPVADALAAFRRVQLRPRLPAPGQSGAGRLRGRRCCGPWSSTTPTGRTCCPTRRAPQARQRRRGARRGVTYVAGMTDRFACRQAVALLDWDPAKLPVGVS